MLHEIKAKFSCDECGESFTVTLDAADVPPDGWSVLEIAEDAIRAGDGYWDETDEPWGGSVQDNQHLCSRCTRKRDSTPTPPESEP